MAAAAGVAVAEVAPGVGLRCAGGRRGHRGVEGEATDVGGGHEAFALGAVVGAERGLRAVREAARDLEVEAAGGAAVGVDRHRVECRSVCCEEPQVGRRLRASR